MGINACLQRCRDYLLNGTTDIELELAPLLL